MRRGVPLPSPPLLTFAGACALSAAGLGVLCALWVCLEREAFDRAARAGPGAAPDSEDPEST